MKPKIKTKKKKKKIVVFAYIGCDNNKQLKLKFSLENIGN